MMAFLGGFATVVLLVLLSMLCHRTVGNYVTTYSAQEYGDAEKAGIDLSLLTDPRYVNITETGVDTMTLRLAMMYDGYPLEEIAVLENVLDWHLNYIQSESIARAYAGQPLPKNENGENGYFALCTQVRNEEELDEWLEYHFRLGVSKIYMFDDESYPPLNYSIMKYIESGHVEYNYQTQHGNRNFTFNSSIRKCYEDQDNSHRWVGILDPDEFIVIVDPTKSIPDVLKHYEAYGSLSLVWKIYGSSGYIRRPPKPGMISNYHHCKPDFHVKSISQPRAFIKSKSTHVIDLKQSFKRVDTGYKSVKSSRHFRKGMESEKTIYRRLPQTHVYDVMYINHYHGRYKHRFLYKKFISYYKYYMDEHIPFLFNMESEFSEDMKEMDSLPLQMPPCDKDNLRYPSEWCCPELQMPKVWHSREPRR